MEGQNRKVGVISCSGEEIGEGTISRLATRKVLEELRPGQTVTICLPLFLAGNEGERAFARRYPTVTIDGCAKACARRGTEAHSGPVSAALVVTDLLAAHGCALSGRVSTSALSEADHGAVDLVAGSIAQAVDEVTGADPCRTPASAEVACECQQLLPVGEVFVDGRCLRIAALPLIFERLAGAGLAATASAGPRLLAMVRVYHSVEAADEVALEAALVAAYREHCANRVGGE